MCTIEIVEIEKSKIKIKADKKTRKYIKSKLGKIDNEQIWNHLMHNDQTSLGNNSEWRYLHDVIPCFSEPCLTKDYTINEDGEYTEINNVYLFHNFYKTDELKELSKNGEIFLDLYKGD